MREELNCLCYYILYTPTWSISYKNEQSRAETIVNGGKVEPYLTLSPIHVHPLAPASTAMQKGLQKVLAYCTSVLDTERNTVLTQYACNSFSSEFT